MVEFIFGINLVPPHVRKTFVPRWSSCINGCIFVYLYLNLDEKRAVAFAVQRKYALPHYIENQTN